MEEALKVENSSLLFERAIPVRIKSPSEDRDAELTIRIMVGTSKHRRGTKVLQVQITNELDPFFLYFLEVSEEDFQSLKVEQCILVDFGMFPHKFIELLEYCIRTGSVETPRFLAVLNVRTGDSTFSVVETNQFKHLSHLSLCFRQGNDSTIKCYLAGRLAEFKGTNCDLHEKLKRTIETLERSMDEANKLRCELGELKEMHSRSINELRTVHAMEFGREKEKTIQEYAELKAKMEMERAEMECSLRQAAGMQESRAAAMEIQVKEANAARAALDKCVSELKSRLEKSEKELQHKEKELIAFDSKNKGLAQEIQQVSKQLNESLVRLAAAEQEVVSKNEIVVNMTRQLESQTSHRSVLEASLRDAQAEVDRAEEKAAASLAEANSCKQTIEKLQGELKSSKAKIKLKAQVTAQQDTLLHERQVAIEKSAAENSSLRQELTAVKAENEAVRKKAEELKGKCEESQESLRSNQQMVQWLNQQLTDSQLGKYSVSSRYKPSASNFEHSSKALVLSPYSSGAQKNLLLTSGSSLTTLSSSSKSAKAGGYSPCERSRYNRSASLSGGVTQAEVSDKPDESDRLTVEWKRTGLPNAQLSFAPAPAAPRVVGLAEEISGGRYPSRVVST